jgi:hypothetical protein
MADKNKPATLPFIGVSEGLDLVKKVWGVTGLPMLPTPSSMAQFATRLPQTLPSMIAPTLDVEELDKRIADLRAVETWLNLNLSMLRTTVQSLEVQRNTIATLKSFGGAMLAAGTGHAAPAPVPAANWPYPVAQPGPAMASTPPIGAAIPPPSATPRKRRSPRATAAAAAAALPLNPVAWWNTLQEQFTKIAATAAAEAEASAKAAAAEKAEAAEEAEAAEKAAEKKAQAPKKAAPRRKRQPASS